jgi:hypothetical protein
MENKILTQKNQITINKRNSRYSTIAGSLQNIENLKNGGMKIANKILAKLVERENENFKENATTFLIYKLLKNYLVELIQEKGYLSKSESSQLSDFTPDFRLKVEIDSNKMFKKIMNDAFTYVMENLNCIEKSLASLISIQNFTKEMGTHKKALGSLFTQYAKSFENDSEFQFLNCSNEEDSDNSDDENSEKSQNEEDREEAKSVDPYKIDIDLILRKVRGKDFLHLLKELELKNNCNGILKDSSQEVEEEETYNVIVEIDRNLVSNAYSKVFHIIKMINFMKNITKFYEFNADFSKVMKKEFEKKFCCDINSKNIYVLISAGDLLKLPNTPEQLVIEMEEAEKKKSFNYLLSLKCFDYVRMNLKNEIIYIIYLKEARGKFIILIFKIFKKMKKKMKFNLGAKQK